MLFSIVYRTLSLLRERKWLVTLLVLANFIYATLLFVEPLFYKNIIDTLLSLEKTGSKSFRSLVPFLLIWGALGSVTICLRLYVSIVADRMAHTYFNESVARYFSYVLQLPLQFHSDTHSGKLSKIVQRGTDSIFWIQLEVFRKMLPDVFTLVCIIPLVLYFHMKLGLIVISVGVIIGVIAFFSVFHTGKKQEAIEKYYTELSHQYSDTFSNMQIIKSFTLQDFALKKIHTILGKRIKAQFPILYWWGFLVSLSQITSIFISILVIFLGAYFYTQNEITIGGIVMFLSVSLMFLRSLESLLWSIESIFWKISPTKEYFEVLDTPVSVRDKENAERMPRATGNIEFRNVDFSYDNKRVVLQGIHFSISAGEKIALVGHTGSGKTTLSNLLLRFYDPTRGEIAIDGQNIAQVTQESLRENIAVVFQENTLFNTTIKHNIVLDKAHVTDETIDQILTKSHSKEFIERLSNGLDTVVGERGIKLSGGEKQRIAIARAFLKDAPILILDEATSALDAQTERYLQQSLKELMKGRTTFIIAHRLSTIRDADRIFVFENGAIVEDGDYKTLLAKGGLFTKLVEAQTSGFIE